MTDKAKLHISLFTDASKLAVLYAAAFPDEELFPLVSALLALENEVISLAVTDSKKVLGHAMLTICGIKGSGQKVGLLGPIAVMPEFQKQGLGTALIEEGFDRLKSSDISHVFVLGDPAYYGRFGFKEESKVITPYPIPEEWSTGWQSFRLSDTASFPKGILTVPEPWQTAKLWSP